MAQINETVTNSIRNDYISLQDVLYCFNTSINEEQAWAICYQCANYLMLNSSQQCFRDLYHYGLTAIEMSKEGEIKIDVNLSQGFGNAKGPPAARRSSFSLNRDSKFIITETDVTQALGTAIYKALDFGLSESEEPHLSPELEKMIEHLTEGPTDNDEGIDIERDSDQDVEENHGKAQPILQYIVNCCMKRLSNNQTAQLHYKAVCRALATEATELLTFLDNISVGQEKLKLTSNTKDDRNSVDDLERSDWARLWVQIMGELRHGVRLKKVEHVHLLPMEFELTPFEILLEDIRLGRYKLNRIMINGDIPPKLKDDAHAVILDFIRSRPPLKPVNKRLLNDPPRKQMDPRELLMQEIIKPHKLKPVKMGKVVVPRPVFDCDDLTSEEESPKASRKVIRPVAAFQVSTDDSDTYLSEPEDNGCCLVDDTVMFPLSRADDTWNHAVTRDLKRQSSSRGNSLSRRHSCCAGDVRSMKKVLVPAQHAFDVEEEEDTFVDNDTHLSFDNTGRNTAKLVSYCQKHRHCQHVTKDFLQIGTSSNCIRNQSKSEPKHAGQCILSKSHDNIVNAVLSVPNNMHDLLYTKKCCLTKSASITSKSDSHRSSSVSENNRQSLYSQIDLKRDESPVRRLSRSETFTCSVPHKSRACIHKETHVAISYDSPQNHASKFRNSFPNSRSENLCCCHKTESCHRHSIPIAYKEPESARGSYNSVENVGQHTVQHEHDLVEADSKSRQTSLVENSPLSGQRHVSASSARVSQSKHDCCESPSHQHARPEESRTPCLRRYRSPLQSPCPNSLNANSSRESLCSVSDIANLENDYISKNTNKQVKDKKVHNSHEQDTNSNCVSTGIVKERSKSEMQSRHLPIQEEAETHCKFIEGVDGQTKPTTEKIRPVRRAYVVKARSNVHRSSEPKSQELSLSLVSQDKVQVHKKVANKVPLEQETESLSNPKREVSTLRSAKLSSLNERISLSDIVSKQTEKTNDTKNLKETNSESETTAVETKLSPFVAITGNEVTSKAQVDMASLENVARKKTELRQMRSNSRLNLEARSRSESKPVKGFHNLPVDLEPVCIDLSMDMHLIVPPPEFRDPVDTDKPDNISHKEDIGSEINAADGSIPDVVKTSKAEFKVLDLLHVSWKSQCLHDGPTNQSNISYDCRSASHKWSNPIECLSLTLEEVVHIRSVLTRAELEGLAMNHELYIQVSRGKVCFTCRKTKFAIFGQWGTKCKLCQRTVCNYCLRKMNVPSEQFEKVPVYTLSPIPLSAEVMEALKVYESTGTIPNNPVKLRKVEENKEYLNSSSNTDKQPSPQKSIKRSQSFGVEVANRPPPNRSLLKGPQVSVCCDCKSMIMEIIQASWSSLSGTAGKSESTICDNKDSQNFKRPSSLTMKDWQGRP